MDIVGHFRTITKHRHAVIRHCFKAGIPWRGLLHDLSKYGFTEFSTGAKYYQKGKRSPNAYEKELIGYSKAWLHHKGKNRHHWEYWVDYEPKTRKIEPIEMPAVFLVEMFCDRVAACKTYRGSDYTDRSSLEYCMSRRDDTAMHPETARKLLVLLNMLAEKGEDATFDYIKKNRKSEDFCNTGAGESL